MSVTSTDLKNLIVTTLANADPTVLAGLNSVIDNYWLLWNRQGYMLELQYWYVRRDAIRYVQAYVKGQIDFLRRNMTASRDLTASARQDASMTASGLENATSNADRSSSSSYSDLTNASGSGSSSSVRNSIQATTGSGSLSDTGSGSNSASQTSTLSSSSTVNASSCDSSAGTLIARQTVSDGASSAAYHDRDNQATKVGGGATGGLNIGISGSFGGSHNFTDTYELENGVSVTTNSRDGQSDYVARLNDARANSMSQSSSQSSSSSFNANRVTSDALSSSGSGHLTASSTSSYTMTGSGSGSMTGTGLGGSTMTASSTRAASGTGEAHRLSVAASNTTLTMEKLHQRFLHLQELWKKANDMIEWYEKQRLALPAYVFAAMTMQYPDGLNADTANAYLTKNPLGLLPGQI